MKTLTHPWLVSRFFLNRDKSHEETQAIGDAIATQLIKVLLANYNGKVLYCSDHYCDIDDERAVNINIRDIPVSAKLHIMAQSDLFVGTPSGFSEIIASMRGPNRPSLMAMSSDWFLNHDVNNLYYWPQRADVFALTKLCLEYHDMVPSDAPDMAQKIFQIIKPYINHHHIVKPI